MKEFAKLISEADEAPPAIHPSIVDCYPKEVGRLVASTENDPSHRSHALTVAHGKKPRAGGRGSQSMKLLDEEALSAFADWAKIKLVAGARHPLALLFNDFEIKPRPYPGPRP